MCRRSEEGSGVGAPGSLRSIRQLDRLHKRYGITGTALSWFETYLTDRCQIIQLNGESSDEMRLQFGVPQGSVLGPLLFTSYTAALGEIARRHGVELHLYADDT